MFHQEFKELEFLVRKFLFLAVDPDSSRIRFQHDVAERDALCFPLRPPETVILRQLRLDLCDKDARGKRLCDVVVRPIAKAADLVDVFPLCRDEHDRLVCLVAKLPADFKAVHVRKHDV